MNGSNLTDADGEVIENMDLLLAVVTGLNAGLNSNHTFDSGNYTPFKEHTTVSNTLATMGTRIQKIFDQVVNLNEFKKNEHKIESKKEHKLSYDVARKIKGTYCHSIEELSPRQADSINNLEDQSARKFEYEE